MPRKLDIESVKPNRARVESAEKKEGDEGRKVQMATRSKVEDIAALRKFEKSPLGKNILSVFKVESVEEILENEEILMMSVYRSGATEYMQPGEEKDALVFLVNAARRNPKMLKGLITEPEFDPGMRKRLMAKMGWGEEELPTYVDKPEDPADIVPITITEEKEVQGVIRGFVDNLKKSQKKGSRGRR